MSTELADYIKQVKKDGYKDEHIVHHLKKNGYSDEDINDAFKVLNKKFDFVFILMTGIFALLVVTVIAIIGINVFAGINQAKANSPCKTGGIEIYNIGTQPSLCISPDKIMVMVRNNGTANITRIDYKVIGSKKTISETQDGLNLVKGDVFPQVITYTKEIGGDFKSISITPHIAVGKKQKVCKEIALTISEAREC